MIRDGILLKDKDVKRVKNPARSTVKSMYFKDFCGMLDTVRVTGDFDALQHFSDPYALMLILGVYETVVLPDVPVNPAFFQDNLTCRTVWQRLKENVPVKNQGLMQKVNNLGQHYLRLIGDGENLENITVEVVLRELSKVRQFDFDEAYNTWVLQPDPEALAFAVLSDYTSNDSHTVTQRITPVLGRPINLVYPTGKVGDIRFPCLVSRFYDEDENFELVQVHKSLDSFRVFDSRGDLVEFTEEEEKILLGSVTVDGLFEGYLKYSIDGSLEVLWFSDVLCLKDVWLHNRPLSERQMFLWHLFPHAVISTSARNSEELIQIRNWFEDPVLVRNLNRGYSPKNRDSHIVLGLDTVVQAEIRKTGGTSRFVLQTSDKERLFVFGTDRISEDQIGKIVDVNRDGTILRHRYELKEAMSWDEVSEIWGVKDPKELIVEGVWPETIKWTKPRID